MSGIEPKIERLPSVTIDESEWGPNWPFKVVFGGVGRTTLYLGPSELRRLLESGAAALEEAKQRGMD